MLARSWLNRGLLQYYLRDGGVDWLAPIVLLLVSSSALSQSAPRPVEPAAEVQRLIERLGSSRYGEREAATRELIATESVRPYVEKLSRASDEELATRARRILAEHDRIYAKTRLERFFRYGREGQVERMVEGLGRWTGPIDNEDFWQNVRTVAAEVTGRVEKREWDSPLPHDFLAALKRSKGAEPVFRRVTEPWSGHMQHGGYLSTGAAIKAVHLGNTTIISGGSVSSRLHATSGIVLVNSDFESGTDSDSRVEGLVIISAGWVKLHRRVEQVLIIAREGIDATDSTYIYRGRFASSGKVVGADKSETKTRFTVEESQSRPLGFIQWFDTSTVGFEADSAASGMKVTSVAAASVADAAGLCTGDLIAQVDGEPVKAARDEFRKQLRRGSVQDACELSVFRGGRPMSIVLDFGADNKR